MDKLRIPRLVSQSRPTLEGAGVHLRRAFGYNDVPLFDPFLMLDDFRSDRPEHYRAGFPWHPHRGIETVTYILEGTVEHGDSLGNKGVIGGDVQWMTAGSGIIHQEMPAGDANGRMGGFQLWANLPAAQKMMDPCDRDVLRSDIPAVEADEASVRVIAGSVGSTVGPVQDIVIDPEYLDITVRPGAAFRHPVRAGHTVFAYAIGGSGRLGDEREHGEYSLVLFGDGDVVAASAGNAAFRFLLISGKPLGEPVAWGGPIVMNTELELETAFAEYKDGTFVKHQRN